MAVPPYPFKPLQDADRYNSAAAVTPSDSVDIPVTRGLYIGAAGALKANMADGTTVTFTALPIGMYPLQVARVWSTGTVAATILALY